MVGVKDFSPVGAKNRLARGMRTRSYTWVCARKWRRSRPPALESQVTLFDLAWEKQWKSNPALKGDDEYLSGLLFDPLDVLGMVVGDLPPPKGPSPGVIDRLGMFFSKVSDGITELSSILTIEVIHGEVVDIMEKLTYDCFDYRLRAPAAAGTRPDLSKFPKKFDHIHLSNIP